jgi:HAD superfamily hydrolase (TIGR01549 family)
MVDPATSAFVFDLGNTLWFEAHAPDVREIGMLHAERLAPLVESWGIPISAEDIASVVADQWDAYTTAWRIELERGTYREQSLPFLLRGALSARGIDITEAQAEAWHQRAYLPVQNFGWQLYPDTLDVLSELKGLGYRVGVNTNRPFTAAMLAPDLAEYGLARYIDAVVCSGDTGYIKPHPSTFERALDLLGVPTASAVMVGDDCQCDMEGAKSVGIGTVLKLNGRYGAPACEAAD